MRLPKPSKNKPTSKLLCKLDTTCSWFSNNMLLEAILIVKLIPSSHNMYIRTFSQLRVMHNEEHKNFYFQINTQKVLVEALTTVHKNQRFFHTCYHVWKHESMGYRIKLRGPLILVVFRVWSSIILLCHILDVHLAFHPLFCPKMKPEPSVQSTLWISLMLFEWRFVI